MNEELQKKLQRLKLRFLSENLAIFCQRFGKQRELVEKIINEIAENEISEQQKTNLERRLSQSKIGSFSVMADFDWNWPKKIPRKTIETILSREFSSKRENVVFMGPEGIGKTMIAQNIAYQAAFVGQRALFTTAADLVVKLKDAGPRFRARLGKYLNPDLLVIDEIGYLSFDNKAADLVYQVVSKRYEKSSTVITTNLAFKDWPKFFPGASSVTALIDRLVHRAHIINIEGDSFRLRESKNSNQKDKQS